MQLKQFMSRLILLQSESRKSRTGNSVHAFQAAASRLWSFETVTPLGAIARNMLCRYVEPVPGHPETRMCRHDKPSDAGLAFSSRQRWSSPAALRAHSGGSCVVGANSEAGACATRELISVVECGYSKLLNSPLMVMTPVSKPHYMKEKSVTSSGFIVSKLERYPGLGLGVANIPKYY